jgi:hypothetical protein
MANPTDLGTIVDQSTVIPTAWGQGINDWVYGSFGVLGSTYNATAYRTALSAAASGANSDITSLTGTATNDNASAGKVGEIISSTILVGSAVALTSGSSANITTLALTAGDWDVHGNVLFNIAATTSVLALLASSSQVSGTHDATAAVTFRSAAFVPANNMGFSCPTQRISIAAPATIYLVATAAFTVSTVAAYGRIYARRAR